jgi:hypothetical protein
MTSDTHSDDVSPSEDVRPSEDDVRTSEDDDDVTPSEDDDDDDVDVTHSVVGISKCAAMVSAVSVYPQPRGHACLRVRQSSLKWAPLSRSRARAGEPHAVHVTMRCTHSRASCVVSPDNEVRPKRRVRV